ncbi:hypothetical protein [Streptomyces sp. NPDC002537]
MAFRRPVRRTADEAEEADEGTAAASRYGKVVDRKPADLSVPSGARRRHPSGAGRLLARTAADSGRPSVRAHAAAP